MDFDATQNLFIEAENLEALKILQKAYAGQVKMIYIDPPYNTGNDSFIYPDKFSETREEYARRVGDTDDKGYLKRDGVFQGAFRKNAKDNGHYHSNWLNMMLPRLHLAKTLLSDDGVIFISIDDNEQAQLKLLCDEVFGEENFVGEIIWQKKTGASDAKSFATITEYITVYVKNFLHYSDTFSKNSSSYDLNRYKHKDEHFDLRGPYYIDNLDRGGLSYSDSLNYGIECPDGTITFPNGRLEYKNDGWIWKWSKSKLEWAIKNNFIEFRKTNNKASGWAVCYKNYLLVDNENNSIERAAPHKNLITDILNANAAAIMKELFSTNNYFNYSKPIELIHKILGFVKVRDNDIILDFFSGSGTTAHAVMQLNAEDGGNRRFICVQLPEETDEKSEAAKAGFQNIAEIAKERIRRAGAKIKAENPNQNIDTGFKVFKLSESHFKQWKTHLTNKEIATPATQARNDRLNSGSLKKDSSLNAQNDGVATQADLLSALENHTDTLLSDNVENIFYELLFGLGVQPTAEITRDNGVYCVRYQGIAYLFVIQQKNADEDFFKTLIAQYQPHKVIVLERIFQGKDDLKKNIALQMKDEKIQFMCV
ncbi:MAG: site-specific DNA-methyltransferase [Neisseriaceae bacterium]|nr:site-specific DNA-methyltransferase [Neisseriaceae bacterium]